MEQSFCPFLISFNIFSVISREVSHISEGPLSEDRKLAGTNLSSLMFGGYNLKKLIKQLTVSTRSLTYVPPFLVLWTSVTPTPAQVAASVSAPCPEIAD